MDENRKRPKKIRWDHLLIWGVVLIVTASAVGILLRFAPKKDRNASSLIDETITIEFETEPQSEWVNTVPKPEMDVQHLTVNEYSRPGTKTGKIKYIVIHYLGNPQTTAQENRDYFESLKENIDDVSMSANFVVGLEGEIIECVPPGEIAYASNQVNDCSISIENCHLEETGRFTVETYETCVKLTAWLVSEYKLDRDAIIRHYDVTGKQCPLYYVQNPDKWEAFRDDVMTYIETCTTEYLDACKKAEKTETEAPDSADSTEAEITPSEQVQETERRENVLNEEALTEQAADEVGSNESELKDESGEESDRSESNEKPNKEPDKAESNEKSDKEPDKAEANGNSDKEPDKAESSEEPDKKPDKAESDRKSDRKPDKTKSKEASKSNSDQAEQDSGKTGSKETAKQKETVAETE